ncbi:MAG: hypothetical protein HS130_01910 [Deltaproteobacteria bacterium]|nr:hypothetical protein [Deltaproteobacteria bacterium]
MVGERCADAIGHLKMGATACFTRPIDGRGSGRQSGRSSRKPDEAETDELERLLVEKYTYAGIVARNPRMLRLFGFLRKIARITRR